jgi:hypothetical protein
MKPTLRSDKVFREIKKQSDYTFVYTKALLKKQNTVTVNINNASVEQALGSLFPKSATYLHYLQ